MQNLLLSFPRGVLHASMVHMASLKSLLEDRQVLWIFFPQAHLLFTSDHHHSVIVTDIFTSAFTSQQLPLEGDQSTDGKMTFVQKVIVIKLSSQAWSSESSEIQSVVLALSQIFSL